MLLQTYVLFLKRTQFLSEEADGERDLDGLPQPASQPHSGSSEGKRSSQGANPTLPSYLHLSVAPTQTPPSQSMLII